MRPTINTLAFTRAAGTHACFPRTTNPPCAEIEIKGHSTPRHSISRPAEPTRRIPTTAIAVLAAAALRLVHAREGSPQHADRSPLGLEESVHAGISVSTESDFRSSAITGDAA
jgi:hypothetical protein